MIGINLLRNRRQGPAVPFSGRRNSMLGLSWSTREMLTPYMFLAPTLIALAFVYLYPMGEAVRMSLYGGGFAGSGEFVGLKHYRQLLTGRYFDDLILTSTVYSTGIVVCVWGLGLGTAVLLHGNFPFRGLVRMLMIVPWAMPYVASAMVWSWIFNLEFGVLNWGLETAGLIDDKANFLSSCPEALISLIGVSTWKFFPFAAVMFLAALQTIPKEYYEAAMVDGAGPAQCFVHITLPGVRSVSIFLFLLLMIWTFGRAFLFIYLLTGGGPAGCTETVVIRGYLEAFQFFHPGTAAALAVIVLLISLTFSVAYLYVLQRREARP